MLKRFNEEICITFIDDCPVANAIVKIFDKDIFVKVRSTGKLLKSKINIQNSDEAEVNLEIPEDGISPGQACVFYKKDNLGFKVLGGGWIAKN